MAGKKIPLAIPDLQGREEEYVLDAVRSTWISSLGEYVKRFEREFAEVCESTAAVTVSNGTTALHLAMLGLGLRPGDEMIVPSMTYIATANAVRYVGAEPVFVDVDPDTWCIAPDQLESVITQRTRGIIAVHLYGHPADMDAINDLAAIHGLWVVEDAAEAHLARYKGRRVGSLAHLATFSFYGNKILTSGEGGAITLSDEHLEKRLRTLRGQGVDPQRRYFFPVVGYNFRLTNVACALLSAQLERADEMLAQRRQIFDRYSEGLDGLPGIEFQPTASWAEPSPWVFTILIDEERFGRSRNGVASSLEKVGVETRPVFLPIHRLPPYHDAHRRRGNRELPVTDRMGQSGLSLPTYPGLPDEDVDFVVDQIRTLARSSS